MTDGTRADTSGWASGAAPCSPAPPPPDLAQVMGVGVAPGNAQLVVTWTAVDTATGYTVQWTSGGQGYTTGDRQATVTSGSTTRYTIPSLINGTALHGASDRDPDGRHRRPALGGGDRDARHHARRAAAPAVGAWRRAGDAALGCPDERRRVPDPPVRVCGRRQRDLDRRGRRSGRNGAGPDERAVVHRRGAGGERGWCWPGDDGDECARRSAAAGVAGAIRTHRHGPCRGCGVQPLARRAAGVAPDPRRAGRGPVGMDRARWPGRAGHGSRPG